MEDKGGRQARTIHEACEARLDQGHHEVEVSFNGEVDLHRHLIDCKKNPGHTHFVPANNFSARDLPPEYTQDHRLVALVRVLIGLAVRISVKYTSCDRPEFVPGTKNPYPFSHYRGRKNMTRTGTGQVIKIDKYVEQRCPCEECSQSQEPRSQWGRIVIATAAHVVCDTSEGKHTTCHFFYDSSLTQLQTCPSVSVAWRVDTDIGLDHSVLKYLTHDMDLINKLDLMVQEYLSLCSAVWDSYKPKLDTRSHLGYLEKQCEWCRRLMQHWREVIENHKVKVGRETEDAHFRYLSDQFKFWQSKMANATQLRDDFKSANSVEQEEAQENKWQISSTPLTMVVSHPHGCSKMVTIGNLVNRTEENDAQEVAVSTYYYSTPTCPGSSGAPVFMLGRWWRSGCDHPHSGSYSSSGQHDQINQSAGGRDY